MDSDAAVELSPKTKKIGAAAEAYAQAHGIDPLERNRLRNAFLEGATFGVDIMREIHAEVLKNARR